MPIIPSIVDQQDEDEASNRLLRESAAALQRMEAEKSVKKSWRLKKLEKSSPQVSHPLIPRFLIAWMPCWLSLKTIVHFNGHWFSHYGNLH